jgi:very-long-chain enoyl-CoA reductase
VLGGRVEGGELQVKDLGPQVSWRTVFLAEYVRIIHFNLQVLTTVVGIKCGPLFIHPLFYHLPRLWYGQDVQHSLLQK